MEIKLINGSSFLIKGKKETVLVNPTGSVRKDARIILYNRPNYDELRREDASVAIMGPGEYEVGGVEIIGIAQGEDNTIYTVAIDKILVGVLGNMTEELSDKKMESVNGVDILIVDIAGRAKDGFKIVLEAAKKWGANYVVPVGFESGNDDIKTFLNETDNEGLEAVESLKIDTDNLPEGMEVVVLKA